MWRTCEQIDIFTWEGSRYIVNVKIITKQGYKNKLLQTYINSTYLDDALTEITNDCLNECLNSYIMRWNNGISKHHTNFRRFYFCRMVLVYVLQSRKSRKWFKELNERNKKTWKLKTWQINVEKKPLTNLNYTIIILWLYFYDVVDYNDFCEYIESLNIIELGNDFIKVSDNEYYYIRDIVELVEGL